MRLKKLPRSFYQRPTILVAKELLGKYLVRETGRQSLAGRIVEVEAYLGSLDPASHSFRGKTRRNEVMFRTGGYLYVYFTYGMHFCCNVVTESEGTGHAVLIRAVEPVEGMDMMRRNRGMAGGNIEALCSGPAKLCQAFGIGRAENGIDLCAGEIWIGRGATQQDSIAVGRSPRIGISSAQTHQWRYFVKENRFVSHHKPAPRNPAKTRLD